MQNQTSVAVFIALGCLIMFLLILVIILFVVTYQRKMLEKENRIRIMDQEKQIALFKATVEAEEKQKEKIARNLHDEINPLLTLLKLNLSKHRADAKKNQFDPETLREDAKLIDATISGIRTSCQDLIPSFLFTFGIEKSVEEMIDTLNNSGTIHASFENQLEIGNQNNFPKQTQLVIYRICMEILNNIIKHTGCKKLSLVLKADSNSFQIIYKHDGNGISNEEIETISENSSGLGLKSLKARVLMINAHLNYLKDNPQSSITLTIPLN